MYPLPIFCHSTMLKSMQEQRDDGTPHRMVGTPINVWAVAKCMYEFIRFGRSFNIQNYFYCHLPSLNMTLETLGRKILRPKYDKYSDGLRSLLLQCLARDPTQRPSPREILRRCQDSLKILDPESVRHVPMPEEDQSDDRVMLDRSDSGWFSAWSYTTSPTRAGASNVSAQGNVFTQRPPALKSNAPSPASRRLPIRGLREPLVPLVQPRE